MISGILAPGDAYLSILEIGSGSGMPGRSGFLGLSFELLDNGQPATHYGFLELSVMGPGDASPYAVELTGFAYESDPGVPITTFAVPEPSTALLLALGLALGALRGRRGKWLRTRAQTRGA